MFKRVLLAYFVANFAIIGLIMWLRGGWYAGWTQDPLTGMLVQLTLVMLPNLLFPFILLRYEKPNKCLSSCNFLGWRWPGRRALFAGGAGFALFVALSTLTSRWIGTPIPYQVPGVEPLSADTLQQVVLLLVVLLLFVGLTVAAEETMFRGLIQPRFTTHFGVAIGILITALLFGLRHLPDDIFYARLWGADFHMWISREIQLYGGAILFSIVRHFGRSTYASAIMHVLVFGMALFS
jgi:membrane protease YdiL (CAAX protease family)